MKPLEPLEPLSFQFFKKLFLLAGTFRTLEPLEPLNFEVHCKIDLYTNFYIDFTSGISGPSRTSKFSIL